MAHAFELVSVVEPAYCASVRLLKWKSRRTGMQLVLIKRQAPCVLGYFVVATEANDNSGCPHTLEHIVFMGSQKYPYKGLLDRLGAKQLSSTNAWTAQDRTCYTLSTAGFEGFKNLLPVYLDHVLNATVEESACLTEVYHIDGKGEEKGVVYSEMQGFEHLPDSLMTTEVQKLLFPPSSGYATNTGGCLSALRELQPAKIRQYHKDVYCPANLSVVVVGDVEPEELVALMSQIDNEIELTPEHVKHEHRKRPFVHSEATTCPSPLKSTIVSEIEFPDSSDSGSGELLVSWLGPHVSDVLNNTAVDVLTTYLSTRGAGKMQVKFVNTDEDSAIASDLSVYYEDYLHSQISVYLYGVPGDMLYGASTKVLSFLESELLSELDVPFLRQCIEDVYDKFVMNAEEDCALFADLVITEFLYGSDAKTFDEWLGSTYAFDQLRTWTPEHWKEFIQAYIVSPPKACVVAKPSEELFKKLEDEKQERALHLQLNHDLELSERMLKLAIEHNERPIPPELLDMFATPDLKAIKFIETKTGATPELLKALPRHGLQLDDGVQSHIHDVDLPIAFESFGSQFVTIKVYFLPTDVSRDLLPLIDSVLSNIFAFPMRLENGQLLSGEEVAQAVKRDLLVSRFGVDCQMQELVSLTVTAKAEKYALAVQWIERLCYNVVFDPEKIRVFVAKHLKSLDELKRSDQSLLDASLNSMLLKPDSLRYGADGLLTEDSVAAFQQSIDAESGAKLHAILQSLFTRRGMRVLVACDVVRLSALGIDAVRPWSALAKRLPPGDRSARLPQSTEFLTELGREPSVHGVIALCASTDSVNLTVVANGPSEYGHPDLPALAVVNGYLSMTEGPFWTAVRGAGYAYGVSIEASVQLGKVALRISSASDPCGALTAVRAVLVSIDDGSYKIDAECIRSAISTIVGELASYLSTHVAAASEKFLDTVLKGYEPDYVHRVISEMQEVTPERFLQVFRRYVMPLVDATKSSVVAVARPTEHHELRNLLFQLGYQIEVDSQYLVEDSDSEEDSASTVSQSDFYAHERRDF